MGTRAATWAGQTPDSCERDEGRVEPTRAEARRLNVLAAASDLFATKGFEATSMRDIVAAVGLMSGSLCYHFASKEDLYVAVQDASVSKIYDSVRTAIDRPNEPWQRLEAALLHRTGFRVLVTPIFPPGLDRSIRDKLGGRVVHAGWTHEAGRDRAADRSLTQTIDGRR